MIRVQHIHGESFVLFDQAAAKQLAGPGTRSEMEERRRKLAFAACPILESYVATILEDLQHSESDEACTEGREPRDSGTVYTLPDSEFEKCRASCERFAAENAETIAEALELEPGRYGRGNYMTADRIGYYFYMMRVGHGVSFSDDYTPGTPACIARLCDAARNFGYMESAYFGDDGRVYLCGGEA